MPTLRSLGVPLRRAARGACFGLTDVSYGLLLGFLEVQGVGVAVERLALGLQRPVPSFQVLCLPREVYYNCIQNLECGFGTMLAIILTLGCHADEQNVEAVVMPMFR